MELYVSSTDREQVARAAERIRRATGELAREGVPVRYVRSIFVPADETCFFLYEAGSEEQVHEVARRAGLELGRVKQTAAVADEGGAPCV